MSHSEDRKAFYQRIDPMHLTPLWEAFADLISPQPTTPCVPALWAYDKVRPVLMESGGIISAQEAERRVLILENPGFRGNSSITHSLYAGLQLVLPGEVAPCHRHSQSALRLIMEGPGAYTSVNGERIYMEKGDFIITGAWGWHDHGNETDKPVIWLDGLDIPLVKFFDASFIERYSEETHPQNTPTGDSLARYGSGMLPDGYTSKSACSPVICYPYARTREALEAMRKTEAWDPHHALRTEFINPVSGGAAMPTISTFMQLLPKGFVTQPYQSTDGTVYTVIEGEGETKIGEETHTWKTNDVFVAPSWYPRSHKASSDAVLFAFSDRTVQQKLGLWKERKA